MQKYVSYTRVSTKAQGKSGLGLDAQKRIIDYFTKDGEIVGEYTEVYSGTKLDKCVELRNAINKTKQLGAKLILAKSDRFRNVKDALTIMEELGEGNLICCDIPNADEFTFTLFFAIARREALITSIRTKQGLESVSKNIEKYGFHISKAGRKIERLGRQKGIPESLETKLRRQENKIFKAKPEPTEREEELLRQIRLGKTNNVSYKDMADSLNILFSDKEREEYFRELNEKRVKRGRQTNILFDKPTLANLWQKYNSEI